MHIDQETCARASSTRDRRFDGRFFIGVTTTGIYCRPVCPAVAPKPKNKRYFPSAAAAAEAGFRPCLRCRPEAAPGTPAWLGTTATVRRALKLIQAGALDSGSVTQLASRLGIGPRHLHRLFIEHIGASPKSVAQTRRLHFAKRLIDETRLSMTVVAMASGFSSLRRFNDAFVKTYGRPPSQLRKDRKTAQDDTGLRLKLTYRPPFDAEGLFAFFAHRALPGVEIAEATSYRRTFFMNGMAGAWGVRHLADRHAIELEIHHPNLSTVHSVVERVRAQFDLSANPDLIADKLGTDPLLGPLIQRHAGIRIPGSFDPFEIAVRAVIGQQVSTTAARTLTQRFVARVGLHLDTPVLGLDRVFPTPEQTCEASLNGLGLTQRRQETLQHVAQACVEGDLDFSRDPAEIRTALLDLPGIGPWTADYIALRALEDPDAFPSGDLVLRKAAGSGTPLPKSALHRQSEAWRPWRAYAAILLWRSTTESI